MFQISKEDFQEILNNSISKFMTLNLETFDSKKAAEILKTNVPTINYLRKNGFLKGIKVGKNWVYSNYNIMMFFIKGSGLDLSSAEKCEYEGAKNNVKEFKIKLKK